MFFIQSRALSYLTEQDPVPHLPVPNSMGDFSLTLLAQADAHEVAGTKWMVFF